MAHVLKLEDWYLPQENLKPLIGAAITRKTPVKLASLIVATLLICGSGINLVGASNAAQVASLPCAGAIASLNHSLNLPDAISNATNSQQFQSGTAGYTNATFYAVSEVGQQLSGSPTCKESVISWNVAFGLYNNSAFAGYLIIIESPSSLAPTSSQFQQATAAFQSTDANMGGYNGAASGGSNVWGAYSVFNVTGISPPASGFGSCTNGAPSNDCDLAMWAGVGSGTSMSSDLAQAGIAEQCPAVGSSCTLTLTSFYETWPSAAPVTCSIPALSVGDSITVIADSEKTTGGTSTDYDFLVDDTTQSQYCDTTGVSFSSLTSPIDSFFMVENFKWCNTFFGTPYDCDPLGYFSGSTISFTSSEQYVGSGPSYGYITSYLTTEWIMQNSADSGGSCVSPTYQNLNTGTLYSGGDFAINYGTSVNTAPYDHADC